MSCSNHFRQESCKACHKINIDLVALILFRNNTVSYLKYLSEKFLLLFAIQIPRSNLVCCQMNRKDQAPNLRLSKKIRFRKESFVS